MADETVAARFKAMGDPTRFSILVVLSERQPLSASQIAQHLGLGEVVSSTLSHHLHMLESQGLIVMRKEGKQVFCELKVRVIQELADHLSQINRQVKQRI